jgi:DNA-binding PadR family transcriptional regulator
MWNIIHLMKTINNISTQLRKGVLEFFVLATLRNQPKYPREIIEELNAYAERARGNETKLMMR